MNTGLDLGNVLARMVKEEASDLFLKVGVPPAIRSVGKVISTGGPAITEAMVKEIFEQITDDYDKKKFREHNEVDLSYEALGVGRFRVNIFKQRGYIGMVFRYVRTSIMTFEELNLPSDPLKKLALLPRGLILITGTAGSGKSTTLASIIEFINKNEEKHVITIEDPIEFTFIDKKCVVEQREVGGDTESFQAALKYVIRQSPDVIMIGEMRDTDTVEAALSAAETGHLVFSTLHTVNAMQTVERIMNFFPPHQHNFLRQQLSQLLEGVISQRLIPTKDGASRVPAIELLLGTPTIKELIFDGKFNEIYKAIKEGIYYGTQTFNQSLKHLLEKDMVTLEDALVAADIPDELKLELRGIKKDTVKYTTAGKDSTTKFTQHR